MYRFNYSVHFFMHNDKIVIMAWGQKITLWWSSTLYEFLVYCLTNIHVSTKDIEDHGISSAMLELLLQYEILHLTSTYQNWAEALSLHTLAYNPNKLSTNVRESDIEIIHINRRKRLSELLKDSFMSQSQTLLFDGIWDLQNIDLSTSGLHSTRLLKTQHPAIDSDYLMSSLKYIHSKHDSHQIYGSGWGMYSVFSLVVISDDVLMIVDNHQKVLYKSTISWLFSDLGKAILPDKEYDAKGYNAFVILISDTLSVFQKYGNRWYRFVLMESGSIGLLRRILYSERWYLELWGYEDKKIFDALQSHQVFTDIKDLIVTHFILLSH